MRTKEQIFEFIATELKNNNTIVVATLGNGGGGLTLLQGDCAEFIEELKTYSFDGKEKAFKNEFEAYNFVRDKENESYFAFNVSDYTDDMIEVTGLDLESISSKVKQDSSKELKVIQDIKLYDKTGKIVFTYGDGNTNTIIETTFNGDSVLQSVLQKINESM
jgi:hypothetical protein